MPRRVLGIDPGLKRIGLAISDPTGLIARPLTVLQHRSRQQDVAAICEVVRQQEVGLIVVGQSFQEDGKPNEAGRRAARLAEALRAETGLPVILWDEAFTTQDARAIRLEMGVRRRDRQGHLDSLAAALLLQSYLDATVDLMRRES
ncbi:MAG: Holliday junction resolvase RuvX [Anaerolineales bacterium]|nr:Holliday junction resolvase RuvX [Anaerolineales bacterium]MCX7609708.1 Holliday junction resolvase RuvX [Anaerolineales bacterium]MDW8227545.1 Holliday junction resolvase RuvX [Anaerolineales bacterium]